LKNVKIAIDYRESVYACKAGKGFYVYNVVEALKRIVPSDTTVYLLVDRDFVTGALPANFVPVVHRLPNWLWHLRVIWDVWFKYDRYLAMTSYLVPWLSFSAKCVVVVHDLVTFDPVMARKHNIKARWIEYVSLGGALRTARKIIAPSQASAKDLQRLFKVPDKKIALVYEGDNQFPGELDVPAVKTKYNIDSDYIFAVGTLEPRKNLERLVNVFARLKKERNWSGKLVLAGKKGWHCNGLFALVRELDLTKEIIFTGYVTEEEKWSLLKGARCYYYVSLAEGFGLPILEAFSVGTPTISANVSSMPEVAGEAAVLVGPEDEAAIYQGIWRLLTEEPLREELMAKGRERLKLFSWQRTGEEIYKTVTE
jgi:glycosyltransferase involved in cell wall biosynthesis